MPAKMEAKKNRFRLTEKEKRELREKYRHQLKEHSEDFQREFKKQLALFITGAFSFVAALLWNGAINKIITRYQAAIVARLSFLPKEGYVVDLSVALVVTLIGVIVVVVVSKILKVEEKK